MTTPVEENSVSGANHKPLSAGSHEPPAPGGQEPPPAGSHEPPPTGSHEPPPPGGRRRHTVWYLLLLLVLVAAVIYFVSGRGAAKKAAKPAAPPAPVLAMPARKGDVGIYVNGLGTVTPLNTVIVRSRVDGQLMSVRFREGQNVQRGELLAVIDPRPFEVQLTQAEGQMARDRALLANARVDLERYQLLWSQDSIPKQQLDTQVSLVRQYEAAIKVDQGQIDAARLQLTYCRITAPVSGRIGLRQVDVGNIIHASDTNGLVIITQLQPCTVLFPISEDSLPPVLTKLRAGARLVTEAYDREQINKLATGTLLTVDNQIDTTTGTVRLKSIFPNTHNELFPNQFVNVRLLLEIKRRSLLIPTSAVQRGPQGTFVYLVKADRTVTVRPITVGPTQGDDTSVTSGLAGGELVVVEGAERLREGIKVDLREPSGGRAPYPGGRQGQGAGQRQGGQAGQAGQGRPSVRRSQSLQGQPPSVQPQVNQSAPPPSVQLQGGQALPPQGGRQNRTNLPPGTGGANSRPGR